MWNYGDFQREQEEKTGFGFRPSHRGIGGVEYRAHLFSAPVNGPICVIWSQRKETLRGELQHLRRGTARSFLSSTDSDSVAKMLNTNLHSVCYYATNLVRRSFGNERELCDVAFFIREERLSLVHWK